MPTEECFVCQRPFDLADSITRADDEWYGLFQALLVCLGCWPATRVIIESLVMLYEQADAAASN